MKNHWRRIGMVYWVQRRRYWTMKRFVQDVLNGHRSAVPTVGQALESKLRKRVFRLKRPGFVERTQYGLDRDGLFDPHAPVADPALLREHKKLYSGHWWEGAAEK
jgi:hypothetical protein